MWNRNVGGCLVALTWLVAQTGVVGCSEPGNGESNSATRDGGRSTEVRDASVDETKPISSNRADAGSLATTSSFEGPEAGSLDTDIRDAARTEPSSGHTSAGQSTNEPLDGGVVDTSTGVVGPHDASTTAVSESTASTGSFVTDTSSSVGTQASSDPSASTGSDDTSDAGTSVIVELPPRPEIVIPPVPSFDFDEASCENPRSGTQTVQLQADIIDLQGIDCILGDLNIWPTSLFDLTGLESLRYVEGNVLVGVSQSLSSFVGLGNLEVIGGNLTIQQTPVLVSATGLSALKRVGGSLNILQNVTLQTLNGLEVLEAVGGNLVLTDNQNLNLLGEGFTALSYVGGQVTVKNNPYLLGLTMNAFAHAAGGMYISDNAALYSIALPALKYSAGDLVFANGATTTLDLSGLEATLGDVHVLPNDEGVSFSDLTSVDFSSLKVVSGELFVSVGADFLAMAWPELLFVDGNLLLGAAEAVLDLEAPKLARVGADLRLQNLDRLRSVELPSLLQVGGVLALTSDDRLEHAHFPELVTVTGLIGASQLPILETLELPKLATAGGFSISECGQELLSLSTVDVGSLRELEDEWYVGYSNGAPTFIAPELERVGAFAFEYNDFVTIEGFPKLESVAADLVVQYHEQLTSVLGFDEFTTVGGDVWMLDNPQLADLTGFEGLSDVAGALTYENLPALSELVLNVDAVSELYVTDCGMGTVAMPELVSAYTLLFNDNSSMTCLHLPKLTTMEPISFGNPPMFAVNSSYSIPACQVDAIRAQIDADDLIYSNAFSDTTAICSGESCY